ncbi:MAG: hypothetical protein IJB97_08255 [Clostridia bacterium]|nr:hypothetical protein [Clostridia bacterium]
MNNQLNFTEEMKEMMRIWKGKTLQSYIENADDGYSTTVRLYIDNKNFDIENGYVLCVETDGENIELTCFSCLEITNNKPLSPYVVGGRNRENVINQRIENILIVKEIETDNYPNGENFEFSYDVALIIQTEKCFFVFWRHLIFDTLHITVCKDINGAVESIKELNEIDEETGNVTVIKSKIVETL